MGEIRSEAHAPDAQKQGTRNNKSACEKVYIALYLSEEEKTNTGISNHNAKNAVELSVIGACGQDKTRCKETCSTAALSDGCRI